MTTVGTTSRPGYVYDQGTDTWIPIGVGPHSHDTDYVTKATVDAKGDLLVGSADNTVSRLAVGTDGYYLTADSAEVSGVKWAAISTGGVTLIQQTATGGTSLSFSSISANYKHLLLTWNGVNSNIAFTIRLNNSSSNIYDYNNVSQFTSVADKAYCERPDQGADYHTAHGFLFIYDYANSSYWKSYNGARSNYSNQVGWAHIDYNGQFRSTSAISSVNIIGDNTSSFSFATGGNVALWGIS